jgi:hypothetical protein
MANKKSDHHRSFDVFLPTNYGMKEIDTVFYSKNDKITEQEVRDSLVNHDGYDFNIVVKENK